MKVNTETTHTINGLKAIQRSVDNMFNATLFIEEWRLYSGQNKELKEFFQMQTTKDFIIGLMQTENLKDQEALFKIDSEGNGDIWMHHLLFTCLVGWLKIIFEIQLIRRAYNAFIKYEDKAIDNHRAFYSAVKSVSDIINLAEVSQRLIMVLLTKFIKDINQIATLDDLCLLAAFEPKNLDLINHGYISALRELKEALNKENLILHD